MKPQKNERVGITREAVPDWLRSSTIFGVAIDASDDPWALDLKRAPLEASDKTDMDLTNDLYDSIAKDFTEFVSERMG